MSITDDIPVDTRISAALHPGVVTKIDGYGDDTKDTLADTMTAFSVAYEGVRAVWDARGKVEMDTSKTADARLLQLDTFAKKKLDAITRRFDATRDRLVKGIGFLEGELAQPLTEKAASAMGAEIRAHVKALTTAERGAFIERAMSDGDEETVAALLGAKPYLSGMTPEMQVAHTRHWNTLRQPEKAKRLHVLQQAKAMIERDAGKVFKAMEDAVGGTSTKARMVREAQMAADKATSA